MATGNIQLLAITTPLLALEAVDPTILAAAVAGDGLLGGGGTPLAVNVDTATLKIVNDILQVGDAGLARIAKFPAASSKRLDKGLLPKATCCCWRTWGRRRR